MTEEQRHKEAVAFLDAQNTRLRANADAQMNTVTSGGSTGKGFTPDEIAAVGVRLARAAALLDVSDPVWFPMGYPPEMASIL